MASGYSKGTSTSTIFGSGTNPIWASKRPDYVVETDGSFALCEVTDLEPGEIGKPVQAQLKANRTELPGGFTTSHAVSVLSLPSIDQRIRDKIVAELGQLGPFRGLHRLAVVLYNSGTVAHLDDHQILSAMSEFLTPELHTDLSAIAVVGTGRPGNHVLQRQLRGLRKGKGRNRDSHRGHRWPSHDELVQGLNVIEETNRAWRGTLTEEHPYLRVYHNYHASLRLPAKTFPGPHASHALLRPDNRDRRFFTLQKIR